MAGKYRKAHNKNRSRFYILLSVIFLVVMFKWGIPLFMNMVAGSGAVRVQMGQDIIPPQTPIISALPEATNSARITVDGFTEVGAVIEILLNDQSYKMSNADSNGLFQFDIVLTSGQNRVQLRAKDLAGNESMSTVSLVSLDNKPINLVVTSPKDGTEYYGKLNQVIDISGSVDKKGVQVLVNNSFVSVTNDGSFVHRFLLSDGDNNITITASDPAGNSAEKSLKIVYAP